VKRGAPLKRRARLRQGRRRVGAAAAERRKAGGKLAVGRDSASLESYAALRAAIRLRAKDRDEIFPERVGKDVAHITARSQGGTDRPWNALWLSRETHEMQARPFNHPKGRLVFPRFLYLGDDHTRWQGGVYWAPTHVDWALERRETKHAPLIETLASGRIDLRVPSPRGADETKHSV